MPASATCVYSSCTEPMKSKQPRTEQAQHLVCAEVGVEGLQYSVAQHIPHTAFFDLTHPPCPCRNALTAHAGEHTYEHASKARTFTNARAAKSASLVSSSWIDAISWICNRQCKHALRLKQTWSRTTGSGVDGACRSDARARSCHMVRD